MGDPSAAPKSPGLTSGERFAIKLQNMLAQALLPLTFLLILLWLRLVRGYRIPKLAQFREGLRRTLDSISGPLLICPNHLTMIDSLILIWAMHAPWKPFFNPRAFPWNTPERRNFYQGFLLKLFCYLGKCIPVVRQGPPEETRKFLHKVRYIFTHGQTLMIFPEGTRSRTGKVDTENFTYGVGKLVDEAQKASLGLNILCIYLRGVSQDQHSFFPKKKEKFFLDFKLVEADTPLSGLRAARDISTRIITTLSELEAKYFSRQNPCW
ncbi:MAG: 1-acyl-sn-glycerol-3-phosphate acyltransferase [Spirochaetales bacterium]|nr:1-acyl-sn-glycerol-3-phosphate acyltransferase [Spirochaetales bacterium]